MMYDDCEDENNLMMMIKMIPINKYVNDELKTGIYTLPTHRNYKPIKIIIS